MWTYPRSAGRTNAPTLLDVRGSQLFTTVVADDSAVGRLTAGPVQELQRRRATAQQPAIGPLMQGERGQVQLASTLGQSILVTRRTILILQALEDARLHEHAQAVGERIGRHAQRRLDVGKAVQAEVAGRLDERGPAIADDVDDVHRALLVLAPGVGADVQAVLRQAHL